MQPLTNKQRKREERRRQKEDRRRQRQEVEHRKECRRRRREPPMPDMRPVLDLARHHRATARQLAMMAVVSAVLDLPKKDNLP